MRTLFSSMLLSAALLLAACGGGGSSGTPEPAAPLRVMALGDSITAGSPGHASYRFRLWQLLTEGGFKVDFVGSQQGPAGGFDADHEGHWGWTAAQVAAALPGWLPAAAPEMVLVHLGTNDVEHGGGAAQAAAALGRIIDEIRAQDPRAVILLAQIIPFQGGRSQALELNALIAALEQQKNSELSPVVLVDQYTGFDPAADTYDGIHPNPAGEKKMAQRWYDAMLPFLTVRAGLIDRGQLKS